MNSPVKIRIIPLALISNEEYLASLDECFNFEVNIAKNITIMHCPSAKENNSNIEKIIFVEIVATAIMLASIGEEQGLDASAKNAPIKNGYKNKLPFLFCGIFFIIVGNCISKKPTRFNPNIIINDAKSISIIGDANPVNALPESAQIIPIMLNIVDKPTENESI